MTTEQLEALRDKLQEAYLSGALEVQTGDGKRIKFDSEAGLVRRLRQVEKLLGSGTPRRPGVSYVEIRKEGC